MLLFFLEILQARDELLLLRLETLRLSLVLIDELLLVVDFLAAFSACLGLLLHLVVLYRVLRLGDHLSDRLAFHIFGVLILHVVVLLAHQVLFKLILDGLSASYL